MGTGIANAYGAQLGQSTPSTQATAMLAGQRAKRVWGGVRKRKRKTAAAPRRRKTAKRARRGGKMVKGSAAARRHMAKLRRMRKRR